MGGAAQDQSGDGNQDAASMRVLVVADQLAAAAVVRDLLRSCFPTANIDPASSTRVPRSTLAATDHVVLDGMIAGHAGWQSARELRAVGFAGGLILITEPGDESEGNAEELRQIGAHRIARSTMNRELPALLGALAAEKPAEGDDQVAAALRELRRTQQFIAAGRMLSRFQHDVNNPLTALLAEAQMLQMDELPAEQMAAVGRIVDACRRVAAIVRELDGASRQHG
jgi:signal transduction histidine kinase